MEIRTAADVNEQSQNFAKELTGLMVQKKEIDREIKALKEQYKDDGLAVGVVVKSINFLKADMKRSESEKFEQDAQNQNLANCPEVIGNLEIMNQAL